jgi:hypothetical protein
MEGQMMQSIKKGTPGAEQITVSFWVKSSNTGTFIAEMRDNDNSRACSRSYTINAANTWEKETITFPADTTGQLDNDNARSMELAFWFGSGSDYAGGTLQTTWGASAGADNTRAAGQLNLANRAGNYIAFTGIQWEIGPVATPFEFEDIGTTLRKCQRYYQHLTAADSTSPYFAYGTGFNAASTYGFFLIPMVCSMRANPSITYAAVSQYRVTFNTCTAIAINTASKSSLSIRADSTGLTGGQGGQFDSNNNTTSYIGISAEL